jgi:hypothetical protein
MNKTKAFLHDYKPQLAGLVISLCLLFTVLAIFGSPDAENDEGDGPLAPLRGMNTIVILFAVIGVVIGLIIVYMYISAKSKFEALIGSKSQAIFKRNQIEIERLALKLTTREEQRVLELRKKYKIK